MLMGSKFQFLHKRWELAEARAQLVHLASMYTDDTDVNTVLQ